MHEYFYVFTSTILAHAVEFMNSLSYFSILGTHGKEETLSTYACKYVVFGKDRGRSGTLKNLQILASVSSSELERNRTEEEERSTNRLTITIADSYF